MSNKQFIKRIQDSKEDIIAHNFANTVKNLETTYTHMDKQAFMYLVSVVPMPWPICFII